MKYGHFTVLFTVWKLFRPDMPPDGYTTVTISDTLATKLTRIMSDHDCSSYAEAIEYAVDTTLIQEEEITVQELIHLLAERVDEVD
ncbi:hypothetical protein JCM31271_31360 [Halorubrum trueperi]